MTLFNLTYFFVSEVASSFELQNHVNGISGLHVVILDFLLVRKILSCVN